MRIDVFLDDATEPLATLEPPDRFEFDSTRVDDGRHELRFRVHDEDGARGERVVPIRTSNGPAIVVHGVKDGDQLTGSVPILVNAYGARVGDAFEPQRIETPAPVPTWAWVLCLAILGWAVGYVSLEMTGAPTFNGMSAAGTGPRDTRPDANAVTWQALGQRVYDNHCASCHQLGGEGLSGIFPPLRGNPAVLDENPAEHIRAVLRGVAGKTIDGVSYPAPMPPFGAKLSDEEIAAVVNHERTQWGNRAPTITAADVAKQR